MRHNLNRLFTMMMWMWKRINKNNEVTHYNISINKVDFIMKDFPYFLWQSREVSVNVGVYAHG